MDKLVLDVRRKNSRVGGYRCPVSQYRTKKAKGKKMVCKGCKAFKEALISTLVGKKSTRMLM